MTIPKSSVALNQSLLVDDTTADAGDVTTALNDAETYLKTGRVSVVDGETHLGSLDEKIKVVAPVTKTINNPTADADLEIAVPDMVGATGVAAGTNGLVPQPAAGDDGKFLKGDGTWGGLAGAGTVTSVDAAEGVATQAGSAITATGTIALNFPGICGVRLSVLTGDPAPEGDNAGKASLYLVPAVDGHDKVMVYTGSRWKYMTAPSTPFSLVSLAANTLYDVFAYDNAGSLDLQFVAWTSSGAGTSTRATALTTVDGRAVKSGDTGKLHIGTIMTNASGGQVDDTRAFRSVWNRYNRVARSIAQVDVTNSWTYSVAAWRQVRGSTANKISIVQGEIDTLVLCEHINWPTGFFGAVGFDLNAATDGRTDCNILYGGNSSLAYAKFNKKLPAVGYNELIMMEYGSASGATFQGDSGTVYLQTGASGEVMC